MKKNLLNYYIAENLISAEQHLYTYRSSRQSEHLHHLRVNIKKIKAILSFIEDVYGQKYDLDGLKPLFHKAGKIRETQIKIRLLSFYPAFPKRLLIQLRKKENILKEQFVRNNYGYIKSVRSCREEIFLPSKLPAKKVIRKYFEKTIGKADKQFHIKERKSLHKFRMKIKKVMYVYDALPERLKRTIDLNKAELDKLQKKAGDWHDTYSVIRFLSHQHLSEKEKSYILKLKEKEKRQFNKVVNKKTPLF